MDLFTSLMLEGNVGIATITRTEIIEGMRDHDRERTMRLLDSLPAFPLDTATADLAGEFIRRHHQQVLILDRSDTIIGATAVQGRCVLVTSNRAHFPMPELALYAPVP
jgi:predicted nucleic acid-binding protein